MWSYRRWRGGGIDLERQLREARAEPREEFVADLSRQLEASRRAPRRAWSRLAFAGALSTLIVGMFASFGGFGYAASGATSTYQLAKNIVVDQKLTIDARKSSARAQYCPPDCEEEQGNVGGETKVSQTLGEKANLPFTGISLAATGVVGFALLGTGIFLRRRERRDS